MNIIKKLARKARFIILLSPKRPWNKNRYVYYWFHHCSREILVKDHRYISDAILNHDWGSFSKFKYKYDYDDQRCYSADGKRMTYFPDHIHDVKKHRWIPLTKKTFNLIQREDSECG